MYKALRPLRRLMKMSQTEMAEALGTDQAQISRLEAGAAGRSFEKLTSMLRQFVRAHPREWLSVLASPHDSKDVFQEYEDLLFVSGDMEITFNELWVVSSQPAEVSLAAMRRGVSQAIKDKNAKVCYWVPDAMLPEEMQKMLIAMEHQDGLTRKTIDEHIRIIRSPRYLTSIPIALMDPHEDSRLGFISPQIDQSEGVRLIVLPHESARRLYKQLENVYWKLELGQSAYTYEGFEWRIEKPLEDGA